MTHDHNKSNPSPYKVRLQIRYDGTDFEGWQRQKEGQKTIQSELEIALARLFNTRINLVGSGRTDSGVHAEGQVAHFIAPKEIPSANFIRGLNSLLPKAIAIEKAWIAPQHFHAQRSCLRKTYRYLIHTGQTPDPLRSRYSTWIRKSLDLEQLNKMAELLLGEKDFKSFQTSGTALKTTVRRIDAAKWSEIAPNLIEFRVTGSGFLKQMVRNIVGTMLYLERNGRNPEDIIQIIAAKTRCAAKTTAPSEGLHLHHVEYPAELDNECREI